MRQRIPGFDLARAWAIFGMFIVNFTIVPKSRLLVLTAASLAIFYLLFLLIPYETGWNFERFEYLDFWTPVGFLRNMFYNGWNPIFPWSALFFFGMWLGRLRWQEQAVKMEALKWSLGIFISMEILMFLAEKDYFNPGLKFFLLADYVPPFLPFLVSGASIAVAVMVCCLWLGARFTEKIWVKILVSTGQMTLRNGVKITSQFDAILLPSSVPSFSLNSAAIRLKR